MKKILAGALALLMVAALAGCGDKAGDVSPSPSESPAVSGESPSPSPTDDAEGFLPDNAIDVARETIGQAGDTVLFRGGGYEVTAEKYLYWLGNMTAYYKSMYAQYYYSDLDLSQEVEEGVTWDQRLKEIAYQNALLLALTPELAKKYDVSLTEAEEQKLLDDRQAEIERAGGREVYAYQLQAMGISDREDFEVSRMSALFQKIEDKFTQDALAGRGEAPVSDQVIDAYIAENDLLRAKHILLLTQDRTTGESYDDEKKAQQKEKIDGLLEQLTAAESDEDRLALFDRLMQENSEDTGLANYPDGYLFTAGEMVSEFEAGTRALEIGEISPVVETSYGYHIILRLDADCDECRRAWAEDRFNETVQEYMDGVDVEKTAAYDSFNTTDFYDKLTAFQEGLEKPTVVESATPSLEPYDETSPTPVAD